MSVQLEVIELLNVNMDTSKLNLEIFAVNANVLLGEGGGVGMGVVEHYGVPVLGHVLRSIAQKTVLVPRHNKSHMPNVS